MVKAQGGDISYIEDLEKFEKAPIIVPVISQKEGFVSSLSAEKIGRASVLLGAGRTKKEDDIDPRVGIILCKKTADRVQNGDILAYVHASDEKKAEEAIQIVNDAYEFSKKQVKKTSSVLEIL